MPLTAIKRYGKRIIGHGESVPVVSVTDYFSPGLNNPVQQLKDYVVGLFPIVTWITRYNPGWLSGDVIAGLTVGIVVVPQGMSYAQLASLPPEYGLYSSFVGVLIYCFFATTKDVSIGPVAVMSMTTAQIIASVQKSHPHQWTNPQIASALAFITGFIVLGIGILRIGWLVEFIPIPAVSGFMTGSAISIAIGQLPGLLGITGFDTRAAPYKVLINTLKNLPTTKLDAAFGISALVSLYLIRFTFDRLSKKYPRRARLFFFLNIMRNAFVLLIVTLAAWLYCRHRKSKSGKYPIKILTDVPAGLKHVGQPEISKELLFALAPELPLATIILLLEHIAIAKSFGRLNGYQIDPNQELIAIGVTNTVGSCFGAYPATGSFSRTALKSKSGVRTPLAGVVTAIVVLVALYGLTPAFYWIPTAGLSAIIIHAVADLVAPPSQVYSYWRVSPLEFIIWWAAVLITVFSSIENGIYVSILASLVLLLLRIAHPRGKFLGRVSVRESTGDKERQVFLPLIPGGITNPDIKITPPSPGVIVYRLEESYLYPNCSQLNTTLVGYVKKNMKRGKDMSNVRLSDRAWNDTGSYGEDEDKKPDLRAIVLDFSTVSHIDTTSVQALIDTRNEVERWADHPVEFHFATVLSPWIRRALVAGGFGFGESSSSIRDIAAIIPHEDAREVPYPPRDIESISVSRRKSDSAHSADDEPVIETITPFFHVDLVSAVRAAEDGVRHVPDSEPEEVFKQI